MRGSPAKARGAPGNRTRRGLWAVAFLTLALLVAFTARETARSLKGTQQTQQVLASAPGIKLGHQDAQAANSSSAGRTPAASQKPQQRQENDQDGPNEREVDPDERELLDLDLDLDAADADSSSIAAGGNAANSAAAASSKHEPAVSSGNQQQGSSGAVGTAAAPAARLPKVKPGQLGAAGDAASEDLALDAALDETEEDSASAESADAAADEVADPDVDALSAIDDNSQSADSEPQGSAAAAGGSSQQQQQSAAQQWSSAQQHSEGQTQDAVAGGAASPAAPTFAGRDESAEPSDEAGGGADASGQPGTEPARDSFPAAKMQALGREAQDAKWAEEDAQRQRAAEAAAASDATAGQQAGTAKSGKQLAAPAEQAPAKQAAAGSSGQGVSDRDGAADGSTQPRAPAKSAAAGSGKASLGGKAAAGSKGGGKGLAAKDKAAAAASAKDAAQFRRQLSALKTQVLDERQLDTGIIYQGDMARVRSFMHKLRHQQSVHIAVVGGSISVGLGEDGFGPGLFRRVAAAFPNVPHRFHNGALGGVMSTYMNSCLKWHVPADVDLVIVEFNCNDGFQPEYCSELPCKLEYGGINNPLRRGYERLLRKLLMLPRRPAVVMLQTFDFSARVFMNSGEDQLGVFAQLYSLPWLSFRGVVWKRQQRNAPGYSIPELMLPGGGDKHPNPYGHQMLADLVAGLLRRAGEGLAARPFTPDDQALVDEDLLPPALPGNIAWDDEYCYIDDKFREKVTDSPGFQWVDEAKPHHLTKKEGFVATKPGAYLLLTVNTAETTQADVPDPHTVVTINHLRSYEHMGQAEITCVSGCTCNPSLMDGHWAQINSQLSMHRLSVSQAKQCTMKIEVLNSTSSGEHKVKIQGLVISDEASAAGELPGLMPQIIPSDLMGAARLGTN